MYDDKPTPQYVHDFGSRMRTQWSNQNVLDDALLSFLNYRNPVDVNKQDGGTVRGFRSGIGGIIVKEDAALMTVTPGIHVNIPTNDEKDKHFASETLEPWLGGAWKLSQQAGQVWDRLPQDLRGIGRCWSNVYPSPRLWYDDEYNALVKAWKDGKEGAEKEIQAFKRDRFPIRWRYVSPRNTWTYFDSEVWLPEVIELRKMTRTEVASAFPDADIEIGAKGSEPIDVYEYANHQWCMTVLGDNNAPQLLREFHHKMGVNPYEMAEAELLPDNDKGWRWAGSLFYAQSMIETFDEIMADLRENHRDNTRTQLVVKQDPNMHESDPKSGGRPEPIKVGPGLPPAQLWTTESIELAPVPQINPQSITLLQEIKQLVYQNMIRPVERGEAKSGTSQNQFVTSVQVAEREFDPSMRALSRFAEGICRRFLRSVNSLSMGYEDFPDKVALFAEWPKNGVIEIGPKEIRGWEYAIQCRMSRAIPIDKTVLDNQALMEKNLGLAPEYWMENTLGIENPQQQQQNSRRSQMADAIFQQVVMPAAIQWAQAQMFAPTPVEQAQLQQQLTGASPDLAAFAEMQGMGGNPLAGPPLGSEQIPGGVLQGAANERRAGSPQTPQQPTEVVGGGVGF